MSKDIFGAFIDAIEEGKGHWILMAQALSDLPDIAEMQRLYAEVLGKKADALTETEKKQAVMNAVLEQSDENER